MNQIEILGSDYEEPTIDDALLSLVLNNKINRKKLMIKEDSVNSTSAQDIIDSCSYCKSSKYEVFKNE